MSAVGIDLGSQNTVISHIASGGVDIILNESSKRLTPALVSFVGNERYLGEAASTQIRTNMANTINQLKQIVGRKFSELGIAYERENHLNFNIVELEQDEIGAEVTYDGVKRRFSAVQLLGMLLTNVKDIIAVKYPGVASPAAVMSVPAFFTDSQRCAVRDAAAIAGIKCLRLLNDGTAASLSYGIYKSAKSEFPEGQESKVLFLDMGHAHFTATVTAFTNASLKVVASVSDSDVGGREFDNVVAKYFADEFLAKTGIDAWSDRKARIKLQVAADKAKTTITPYGVNLASVGIECLKDDRDYSGALSLEKFEVLAADQTRRLAEVIKRAMVMAKVEKPSDFYAIELIGGAMRMRCVKRAAAIALGLPLVEETGHGLGTTMNLDEAVARGCALACAKLVPSFRVKPFEIIDSVQYGIKITWAGADGGSSNSASSSSSSAAGAAGMDEDDATSSAATASDMVIFGASEAAPASFSRRITFKRAATFEISAEYQIPSATAETGAGKSSSGGITEPKLPYAGHPTLLARYSIVIPPEHIEAGAPPPKVRVDFTHDMSGVFTLDRAQLIKEVKEEVAVVPPPVFPPADGTPADAAVAAATGSEAAAPAVAAEASGSAAVTPKKKYTRIDLAVSKVSSSTGGLAREALSACVASETAMIAADRDIRSTHDMRNSLEAYAYAAKDALDGEFAPYSTDAEKETLSAACSETETWLYDNMEAKKEEFQARLKQLHAIGDVLKSRKQEDENRASASSAIMAAVEDFRGIINNRSGKHGHLTETDKDTMRAACSEAEAWFRTCQDAQAALPLNVDPAFRVAEVYARRDRLVSELRHIANKPVPKPAPVVVEQPPPTQSAAAPSSSEGGESAGGAAPEAKEAGDADMQTPPPAPTEEAAGEKPAVPAMNVD